MRRGAPLPTALLPTPTADCSRAPCSRLFGMRGGDSLSIINPVRRNLMNVRIVPGFARWIRDMFVFVEGMEQFRLLEAGRLGGSTATPAVQHLLYIYL